MLTNSNKFFVDKSIDNIKFVLIIIKKHNTFSNLDKVDTEKKIEIPLKDNIYFLGFMKEYDLKKIEASDVFEVFRSEY